MATIGWCKRRKGGIRFIPPNEDLFLEYISTAEETLEILMCIKGKSNVWNATAKYYCEYFAIYALLMRIGIRCEIHECTISLALMLEKMDLIPKGYAKLLLEDKKLRIENQYYLKNQETIIDQDSMVEFVFTIKKIGLNLPSYMIERVRKIIQEA